MTSTLPPVVQAFSGALGSAAAGALTYPLDLVTTRLQLQDHGRKVGGLGDSKRILRYIIRKHGIAALYDGLLVDTTAKALSSFLYFYFYSWLRSLSTQRLHLLSALRGRPSTKPRLQTNPSMVEEFILGFLAGVASRAISTPLNIVTLRLQTERENEEEGKADASAPLGVMGTVKVIHKERGLAGFWKGFGIATILSLNPSITLTIYQIFRRVLTFLRAQPGRSMLKGAQLMKEAPSNPSPGEAFIGAAVSNSIAVVLLYPLMLAKTRLQHSSVNSLAEALLDAYQGTYHAPRVKREEFEHRIPKSSPLGLYQGLEAQIVKGFLSQGVTFLVKGRVEQLIVAAYLHTFRKTMS